MSRLGLEVARLQQERTMREFEISVERQSRESQAAHDRLIRETQIDHMRNSQMMMPFPTMTPPPLFGH